ncbi:MAG: tyrosine-protein phosphatase [Protaetiibacter sp.]
MEFAPGASAPALERHRTVPGTYNLRETGGYRAAGGTTRWGKLFRSDALHRLDESAREQLRLLGIRQVIDLRDPSEAEEAPSRLDGLELVVHELPVFDGADPARMLGGDASLEKVYAQMIERHGTNLGRAVRVVARSGDEPVLVHCTAGKDRTGLVVAFALLAAGVDREDVIADYAQSEVHLAGEWADGMRARFAGHGVVLVPEVDALISSSPAELLSGILDRLEAEHGSIIAYLASIGVGEEDIEAARTALLEPSSLVR